ncbi:d28176e0-ae15-4e73-950a-d4f946688437 [Thermothielavioides terrestris]|uniref:Uncharacterized protein n=2 Tax=Thermothielavioides terrestris TaxID=2587410 RepID=G2QSL9_THETT|nr:uncharacterized protein THITE_2126003 [Thermothielavioides terrestris NRRL 8126]AEO63501.1 hypothetical protein THITE_2126003 [Thermothielavioides terrestris NRRL 8126]SPQ21009.1 d28176e0-ae15-4e73-950a-d4f946688437 [Thermothielavioides terrestris]
MSTRTPSPPQSDPALMTLLDVPKPLVYTVGDCKLTQKWKSEWLAMGSQEARAVVMDPIATSSPPGPVKDVTRERCVPLRKVATYCRYGQVRYAFILTQTELVALRIRRLPLPGRGYKHRAAVEYASVPWEARRGLTVNLAIWALGCMGMKDEHREMETSDSLNQPIDKMARLTWWKFDPKAKMYQNVISKRQIPLSGWKTEYEKFVQLTEQDGNSFTAAFW